MFSDAIEQLLSGHIGIIPTDTIYGIVAKTSDPEAVKRLYETKHRIEKPGTIIAASIEQLVDLGIKRRYLTAVEQYWPGPVSVVIPCADPELNYLHQSKMSLSVRVPADPTISKLLESTGPLLTTSANHPGQEPATTVRAAREYFGDQVDFYVDGGDLSGRQPSTILRIVDDAVEVLRQGAADISNN